MASPSRTEYRVLERGSNHTVLFAIPWIRAAAPDPRALRLDRPPHRGRPHLPGRSAVPQVLAEWLPARRVAPPAAPPARAGRLAFDHPFTGRRLAIEAPVPGDFTATVAALPLREPARPDPADLRSCRLLPDPDLARHGPHPYRAGARADVAGQAVPAGAGSGAPDRDGVIAGDPARGGSRIESESAAGRDGERHAAGRGADIDAARERRPGELEDLPKPCAPQGRP